VVRGLSPWTLTERDGAGTGAHRRQQGQHSVNMQAMANVLAERGRLASLEDADRDGEETGSPGLREVCDQNRTCSRPTC